MVVPRMPMKTAARQSPASRPLRSERRGRTQTLGWHDRRTCVCGLFAGGGRTSGLPLPGRKRRRTKSAKIRTLKLGTLSGTHSTTHAAPPEPTPDRSPGARSSAGAPRDAAARDGVARRVARRHGPYQRSLPGTPLVKPETGAVAACGAGWQSVKHATSPSSRGATWSTPSMPEATRPGAQVEFASARGFCWSGRSTPAWRPPMCLAGWRAPTTIASAEAPGGARRRALDRFRYRRGVGRRRALGTFGALVRLALLTA